MLNPNSIFIQRNTNNESQTNHYNCCLFSFDAYDHRCIKQSCPCWYVEKNTYNFEF